MDKREKLAVMDKILRELEDVKNSQAALVKKLAQVEAENINLGDQILDKKLPDIFKHADDGLTAANDLITEFSIKREKYIKDNKLDEVAEV